MEKKKFKFRIDYKVRCWISDFVEIEAGFLKEAKEVVEKNKNDIIKINWHDVGGQLYNTETDYGTMELIDKSENKGFNTVVAKYIGGE